MERFGALCFVLTFVSVCQTIPQETGTVSAVNGRLGLGQITGGQFGPGSFSIGAPGQKIPTSFETEDGVPVVTIKPKRHRNRNKKPPQQHDRPIDPNMEDDAESDPDKHQKKPVESEGGGRGGEGGSGGGQITIGKIVIAKNNNNQENRRKNNHQEPVSSNEPTKMSNDKKTSIEIKPVAGGHSGVEAKSINNQNIKPGNNVPEKTLNNVNNDGYIGRADVKGHGSHENGNQNVYDYTGGSDERWVWQ